MKWPAIVIASIFAMLLGIGASGQASAQLFQSPCVPIASGGCSPALTPIVSASAEATHVLKAAPGNLYSVYATNLTSTAGFLAIANATAAPADGAITPLDCVPLPASGNASISYGVGPPAIYSVGIVAIVTSAANCFTKTTGTITAFIKGAVQ